MSVTNWVAVGSIPSGAASRDFEGLKKGETVTLMRNGQLIISGNKRRGGWTPKKVRNAKGGAR